MRIANQRCRLDLARCLNVVRSPHLLQCIPQCQAAIAASHDFHGDDAHLFRIRQPELQPV